MLYFLLCKTSKADANGTKQKEMVIKVVVQSNVVAVVDAVVIPGYHKGSID